MNNTGDLMVKGETRVEIYNPDGSFNTVLVGPTPQQLQDHLDDRRFCPPGCTIKIGKSRGRG